MNVYKGWRDERGITHGHVNHFHLPLEFGTEQRWLSDKAVHLFLAIAAEAYTHSNTELHLPKAMIEELTNVRGRSLTRAIAELNRESKCIRIKPKAGAYRWYRIQLLDPDTGNPHVAYDNRGKARTKPYIADRAWQPCPELHVDARKTRKKAKRAKVPPITVNLNVAVQGQAIDGVSTRVEGPGIHALEVFGPKRKIAEKVDERIN